MPSFDGDAFAASSSRFLTPGMSRGSSSKQSITGRRSIASLRGTSLAQTLDDDAANGRHSLAHELAVALMPEPSAGSMLLAEEFGIEYDEGAEGIDEDQYENRQEDAQEPLEPTVDADNGMSNGHAPPSFADEVQPDFDPAFNSPRTARKQSSPPEQDPMVSLAQDLEATENFLSQLRRLDVDHAQPNIEGLASDLIRRIDDTARDREGQVRELLECEREFRRIAGEIGGNDVLGQLDELEDLVAEARQGEDPPPQSSSRPLDAIHEESSHSRSASLSTSQVLNQSADWEAEMDRDRERLGAEDEEDDSSSYPVSPIKSLFPPPTPVPGPPTPAKTISQLAHLRTFTTSVASSLATISEQTQVNAAATTEAGRKIRSLKNKLGGWRTDWDSAERSRVRIEKWEAGILDVDGTGSPGTPGTPSRSRRVDGRKLVQEHLQAFERALSEANLKTQAIMAAAS